MIEQETTIRFRPEDVPPLPELYQAGRRFRRRRREVPPPEDWVPIGVEW